MTNKAHNASLPVGSKPSGSGNFKSNGGGNSPIPKRRYFHYLIFVILVVSSFFNLQSLWGLFFIGFTLVVYRNRAVYFLDMIERDKEPVFYWLVFITWLAFGVLIVLQDWDSFGQWISWS